MDIFFDDVCKPKRSRSLPKPVTFATTPGRGQRDPFQNFLACFKQQNAWVEEGRIHEMAIEMWEKFDKTQRREFYQDLYKIRMAHKLAMVTLTRTPDKVQSETLTESGDMKTLLSPRRLDYSESSVFYDKAVDHSNSIESSEKKASLNKLNEDSIIDLTKEKDVPEVGDKDFTDSKDGTKINWNDTHIRSFINFLLKKKFYESEDSSINDIGNRGLHIESEMSMNGSSDLNDTESNYSLPDPSTVDIANLSNTSIAPNEPFINFLHDFSIQANTKPVESYDEAAYIWSQMKPEEKSAYEPENFVLKLLMQNENLSNQFLGEPMDLDDQDESSATYDDDIKVILPPPSERRSEKAGTRKSRVSKKPLKRLNAGAKQSSPETHNRRGQRSSPFQNFLTFMQEQFEKSDSFNKTLLGRALWRHMTSNEKNIFANNDFTSENAERYQDCLYELGKEVKGEAVETMPYRSSFSKMTQVSEEDLSQVSEDDFSSSPSGSKSPYIDQSYCSINSRPSSEFSDQSSLLSLDVSNGTLNFKTSTISDSSESVFESESFATDNSSQTMESESESNSQPGNEWTFLKYFRRR